MLEEKRKMIIPDISQQSILHVNAIPDNEYPLRILRAYRENCNCKWISNTDNKLIKEMNKLCDERAEILDKAIAALEAAIGTKKQCLCDNIGYSKYCPIHGYMG